MQKFFAFINRRGIAIFSLIAITLCSVGTVMLSGGGDHDILHAANMLGPAASSILEHKNLDICSDTGRNIHTCSHSGRMPFAPFTLAVLYSVFHNHYLAAIWVKALLFFVPVLLAFVLAWNNAQLRGRRARLWTLIYFTVAIALPPTLAIVANINFEEGFYYSWLALAICVLLFPQQVRLHPTLYTAVAFVSIVFTYLSKSSMLLMASALTLLLAMWLTVVLRRFRLAAILVLLFTCVPIAWGLYQHHAGGRFTMGTSFDGVNFYKGNNPYILDHYPPPVGSSLDPYDASLYLDWQPVGEWSNNDGSMARAKAYIQQHPAIIVRADLRKVSLFFLSIQRYGGGGPYRPIVEDAYIAGMVLFRLMLLSAIALSIFRIATCRGDEQFSAIAFLSSVLCAALPYIAGFALTRHATVLILPVAAYLSSAVGRRSVSSLPSQTI
jgi:hypothetical protein